MNLLIVLHFDLLPFFLDSLTDIRAHGKDSERARSKLWRPGASELDTQPTPSPGHGLLPTPCPPPPAAAPPTPHKAGSLWHSIFYFLKLYTDVKYFNSKSMGKLFGFKLL